MVRTNKIITGCVAILICILIYTGVSLRFADLEADPPAGISSSAGVYFDGQSNAHGARSYVRFGNMRPDEWDTYLYSPTYTLLQIPWFKVFGTGLRSTNGFAATLSTLAMLLAILLFRHKGPATMQLAALVFSIEYLMVQLGRIGLVENLVIVCMLASLCCLQMTRRPRLGVILCGFFAMCAFITKAIVPYFPIAVLFGVAFGAWQEGREKQKTISCISVRTSLFVLGILLAMVPWLLFYRIPNAAAIKAFGGEWVKSYMPGSMGDALAGMTTTPLFFNIGQIQNTWVIALPSLAAIAAFLFLRPKRLSAVGVALAAWLVGACLFVAMLKAGPIRYSYPLVPAFYCVMVYGAGLLLDSPTLDLRFRCKTLFVDAVAILAMTMLFRYYIHYHISLNPILPRVFPRVWELMLASLFLATAGWALLRLVFWIGFTSRISLPMWVKIMIVLSITVHFAEQNKQALRRRWAKRQHSIVDVSRMLEKKYPGMVIGGATACTLAIETDAVAVRISKSKYCNWSQPFERYGITHACITDYAGETARFFRLYPEAMTNTTYKESVVVCGYTVKIYETAAYSQKYPMTDEPDTP